MKNKTTAFVLLLLSLFAPLVDASSLEKAEELMQLMEIRKNIDASQAQITDMMSQMIASQGLSEEETQEAIQLSKQSMDSTFEAMKEIDWEKMFGEIYASVFSEEEIQGLIDFYKSPVGQKFLEKQPELMAATMQKMQGEMMKIMPQIQADVMKAIEEAQE